MLKAARSGVALASYDPTPTPTPTPTTPIGVHPAASRGSTISLLRTFLSICCITGAYCDHDGWRERIPRGIKDLQIAMSRTPQPAPILGYCDFEESCDWSWNQTLGFKRAIAPIRRKLGPTTDASKAKKGHFLWYAGRGVVITWSRSTIYRAGSSCLLEFASHQTEMRDGAVRVVIVTNGTTWVAAERPGNNHATWEITRFNVGAISQPFRLILEIVVPYSNSTVAVDNLRLVDCFPESTPLGAACTEDMFRCNNGSCLNRTRICDLTKDCADGEDELMDCDKIPENARCNFEHGWCGWTNVSGRPLNWTLNRGPTPSQRTGPSYDHTYRNSTGTYAYVNMSKRADYGSRGTIASPMYNPTPPYSSDPNSRYHQSCQVRFFYHQYGVHSGSLGLYLIQVKPHQNHSNSLWWSYGDRTDVWYNQAVALPDIRYRYFLQFEASRGYASKGDVAIDDFSLSPECFGIGVPPEVVGDFNYYNPVIESEKVPEQHVDFINKTVVHVSTCGASGKMGPTAEQCAVQNNGTDIEYVVPQPTPNQDRGDGFVFNLNGIQRWTAPRGGYYTVIGMGARGGRGSGDMGSALGAQVGGVVELEKGQQLYFMIGQAGVDACPKSLGLTMNSCQSSGQNNLTGGSTSMVREVKKIKVKDGGGGGGGATYVFALQSNGRQRPLIIAAGGGGLGLGQFVDNGLQHGRGPSPLGKPPSSGLSFVENAGGGGGWNGSWKNVSGLRLAAIGMPLVRGGIGGHGCGTERVQGYGDGGFGGGGGGCLTGGGGGGYIGGNTGRKESGNGEGGYSFASTDLMHVYYRSGAHHGPGEIYIIPAISGCGCDFRCVALDHFLSEIKCLCPPGWLLSNDSRSCLMADDSRVSHETFIMLLIGASIALLVAFTGLCVLLYNRYQNRKALLRRRQVMFGNGTELTALRAVSESMMTEFNPNYEFAGNLYSFKDLPQIPREYISLVKPLGQGAFGEVFQGVYKYRREEHPVAVKTLPSLSTNQAEADFMMEALIMSKFNHPNIVHFIGISFDKHPRYIVLELLAGGDLKNFLREERPRSDRATILTMLDLIMCAFDVANGCKYMEEARFIHRDIAARNCLLTCKGPGRAVKIADFGMARDIYRSDYYRKGGKAMLPIKWMPPESFLDGIFTTKTDVWAFGVLLWEIMSFGYMPYTGCANRQVMSMVTSGGRLERPAGCPDPIYGIMTRCWHPRPEDRPSFATIAERIGYCLQDPDVINHPTPNYDILPVCDREITIMRPDPEAECINVNTDVDGCGYMQPRPSTHRGEVPWNSTEKNSNENNTDNATRSRGDQYIKNQRYVARKTEGLNQDEDSCVESDENDCGDDDEDIDNCGDSSEERCKACAAGEKQRKAVDTVGSEDANAKSEKNPDNGNGGTANYANRLNVSDTLDVAASVDRKNGNESTTTTDTNSDSLLAPLSDTPPHTTTNSSPNTRTCSPSRGGHANVNNVNGMLRKSALKAALSLDPSALYRGTIPYEKIAFKPQQQRTTPSNVTVATAASGNVDVGKDSLGHELPREEECSC